MSQLPATPFLKDVMEQPAALSRVLDHYEREPSLLEEFQRRASNQSLLFVGMGSSLYAPYSAALLASQGGLQAQTQDASEVLHYRTGPLPPNVLPVLVSQSGESVEVVKYAERIPGLYAAITNDPNSSLARGAALVLPIQAGPESSTSSKTFVNTVAVSLLAVGACTGQGQQATLRKAVDALQRTIENGPGAAESLSQRLGREQFIDVVARGPALGAAMQSALILREMCSARAASLSGGLFRHGPIHDMGPGRQTILFASGQTEQLMLALAAELVQRGVSVSLVANGKSGAALEGAALFSIPAVDEFTFPIPAVVAAELLGCWWAAGQGKAPGEGVEKITRTE